jgi:predicted membrane-bound spermidine synthase
VNDEQAEPGPRAGFRARVGMALLAGAVGFAVTTIEFGAVRQVAPAFGQSVHVWAATIGVLLLALAAGNTWAGRASPGPHGSAGWLRRAAGVPHPALALGVVALWEGLFVRVLGAALLRVFEPSGLPSSGGLPLGLVGAILGVAALHALPLVLLGTVTPWLVRAADADRPDGRSASWIYAAATVGALIGCWAGPLWLLQSIGTRLTLLVAGVVPLAFAWAIPHGRADVAQAGASEAPGTDTVRGSGGVLLAALLAGFAVMALEFLAVRLFGPWFGQSNRIWANTIGVILLALALGSWLGGRLGRLDAGRRTGSVVLLLAALTAPVAAWVGPALAETLLPRDVDYLHVLPVAFRASLAATAVLFGVPLVLLGAVPPLLVRRLAPRWGTGRAAGFVGAAGTLGSLAGTFAGPLLLVPVLGSRRGLLLVAALLLPAAALAWAGARGRAVRAAGLAVGGLGVLAVLLLAPITVRVHPGQMEEVESAYQTVRAVREKVWVLEPQGIPAEGGIGNPDVGAIFLRHDEDADTYQSIWIPERTAERLSGGRYYEQMALGARLARPAGGRLRVLIVGYAGGAVHRTLRDTLPPGMTLEVLGVEIDPEVVNVARRRLDLASLEGPDLTLVTGEDARTVVNALPSDRMFDLVLVDAYARTNYIPFQLATQEFFARVKAHLAPQGWVGVNVLGLGLNGPVCRAVATTMAHAVGPTYVHPNLWFPGNVILWACAEPGGRPWVAMGLPEDRLPPLLEVAAHGLERLAVRHAPKTDGGVLLTDDLSPSDRLADEELGL